MEGQKISHEFKNNMNQIQFLKPHLENLDKKIQETVVSPATYTIRWMARQRLKGLELNIKELRSQVTDTKYQRL